MTFKAGAYDKIPVLVLIAFVILFYLHRQNIEENFFSPHYNRGIIQLGYGTGFFVDDHHIVTNHHVIHQCGDTSIKQYNGNKTSVTLVAEDPYNDLALLKLAKPVSHEIATIQHSDAIKEQAEIHIIGYPDSHYRYIKAQIIHKDKEVEVKPEYLDEYFTQRKVIYTDSVRKGNSGGAILDHFGAVVGVADAYVTLFYEGKEVQNNPNSFATAIHPERLKSFLDKSSIAYQMADRQKLPMNDQAIEELANSFMVQVKCVIDFSQAHDQNAASQDNT